MIRAGKKSYFPNPYFLFIVRPVFRGYFFGKKKFWSRPPGENIEGELR
jgi:hypothetical protein